MEKYCVYAYIDMSFHINKMNGWETFQLLANNYLCNDISGYFLKKPINDNNLNKVHTCKR